MLVDKQSELMSDLLFTVHQHGGDDVTWKQPITLKRLEQISLKSLHVIFLMYLIRSETFIKIG